MRLGKAGEPTVHEKGIDVEIGDIIPVINGEKTAILCTGAMLKYAVDYISGYGLPWSLYSVPFVKPLHKSGIESIAKKHSMIITLEEHQLSGGFGSAILELLSDLHFYGSLESIPKVRRLGVPDRFMEISGGQAFLRKQAKLLLDDLKY